MRRNLLLIVLAVSVTASCSSALAQSRAKGKKKEPPRVLKEGDEVKVWLDPAETLRDPNLEKSGVITSKAVVLPTCRQDEPNSKFAEYYFDTETYNLYVQASKIGDKTGIDKMIAGGRAVRLPVGTKLLVLSRSRIECRARVVEGEYAGRVVEVNLKYLH